MRRKHENPEPQSGATDSGSSNKDPFRHATFYLLAATALFTGWYAVTASDMEQRQLRAYISIVTKQDVTLKRGEIPVIPLEIKNVGMTPAFRIRAGGRVIVLPYPLPGQINAVPKPNALYSNLTLFPTKDAEIPITGDAITLDQYSNILSGEHYRLFFVAHAEYEDVWGRSHFTHFCMMNASSAPGAAVKPHYCDQYNEAE
jgi:hypothetical protein